MGDEKSWTKREFLQSIGAGVPALKLMPENAARSGSAGSAPDAPSAKFTPIDCSRHFTTSSAAFGPRDGARGLSDASAKDGLIRTPTGNQTLRGIPFALGPADTRKKSWIVLSRRKSMAAQATVEIPVARKAGFVCLVQFCDWDENEAPPAGKDAIERVGQRLADAVLVYEDGTSHTQPIRRRFEVNSPSFNWGHLCFTAVTHRQHKPTKATDPLPNAQFWGDLQMGIWDGDYGADPDLKTRETVWISAIENPFPDRPIKSLRFAAKSDDPLAICGITLFHGRENPLRYERLQLYRITLPQRSAEIEKEWKASVDLGLVARTYSLPRFDAQSWLAAPLGPGDSGTPAAKGSDHLYVEVASAPDATLTLHQLPTGFRYEFELAEAKPGQELQGRRAGARLEVLEREKTWIHGKVVESGSGQATPVRISFRSRDGRYIPPYGHRTEISTGWFQDYGADVKSWNTSYAYVDGSFQIELPVGEVFVEATKGFEYEPLRKKLVIEPGQRELRLEVSRFEDLRSKGWVSADAHVHFLSPTTAILEAQAEGLNLINLLAAQWGDLFTNVGDLSHGPLTSKDGETMVWVGTENRQHILGHLALLGGNGSPVFPMSAAGPHESYVGDTMWNTLAEWADTCRERQGLVVAAHFPYPTAELAADIVMEKIDAVELWPQSMGEQFNNVRFLDWYRFLNCGYRLPAVAGTDKMSASVAAGSQRGYAYLGQDEFTFANWAKAVRKGNTFMSSGPLISLQADGRSPGEEITLRAGGGAIEVQAEARSTVPVNRLEIVVNGAVVASSEEASGACTLALKETVRVPGPAWIAARCASRYEHEGVRIAAHTSPIYVAVPGEELFSGPAATYMLTLIDGSENWVRTLAIRPPDKENFVRALALFKNARERLHARMHKHGVAH